MRKLFLILTVVALVGCAHAVPSDVRGTVDKSIPLEAVFANPQNYEGHTMMAGGLVIAVRNKREGSEMEVLQKPLDSTGKPRDVDESLGRFLVKAGSYIDPALFETGRQVTVVGRVEGSETRKIGDVNYDYLVMSSGHVYLSRPRGRMPVHFGFGVFKAF